MQEESNDPLLFLAGAVLEGRPIDWKTATSSLDPEDASAAAVLEELVRLFAAGRDSVTEEDAPEEGSPERWGNLAILGPLGQGTYGRVYRAWDERLRREVALKVRQPGGPEAESFHRAVLREGQLLAQLRHENVAAVYGVVEEGDRLGLVMELVEGETLEDLVLSSGALPAGEVVRLGRDLAGALAALHAKDIVHRDVKAQNVLRQKDGRVVLVDFGVGVAPGQGLGASTLSGTPLYMAPELLAGGEPTAASDLYSLGVLLFFLATGGKFPVDAESVEELIDRHRQGGSASLRKARKELPKGLVQVIESCLAARPEGRPESARAVEESLREESETRRRARRWRRLIVAGLIAVGIAALLRVGPPAARSIQVWWLVQQANQLQGEAKPTEALVKLDHAWRLDPQNPGTYVARARVHEALGDFERSLADSQEAFELQYRASEVVRWRINVLYYRDRLQYETALEKATGLAEIPGASAQDYREMAHLYERLGNLPRAIEEAERAIERDDSPANVGLLGLLLIQKGKPSDALVRVKAPDSAVGPGRDVYLAWVESLAFISLERLDDAWALLEPATDSADGYNWWAEHWLAQLAAYQGRVDEAYRRLEERRAPADATDAYFQRRNRLLEARISLLRGEHERAGRALGALSSLESLPAFLREIRSAGLIWAEMGVASPPAIAQVEAAQVKLKELNTRYPSRISEGAVLQLGAELALLRGDSQHAGELWDRAREKWTDPEMLRTGVRIARVGGRDQEERALLQAVVQKKGEILRNGLFVDWKIACQDLGKLLGHQSEGCPDAFFPPVPIARR